MMTLSDLGQAALDYVDAGLMILPLAPGTKVPMTKHGVSDATDDRDKIRRWWEKHPQANIGIATGHLVDVIDLDGWEGQESFAMIMNQPTIMGTVATVRDGGLHLYISATGKGNRAKMIPGVDYRGSGGYVVAPPSMIVATHDQDVEGTYVWIDPLNIQATRDENHDRLWWLEVEPEQRSRASGAPVSSDHDDATMQRYLDSAIRHEIERIDGSQSGQRNHDLNVAAFNLGQLALYLDESMIRDMLANAARARGLRDAEIMRTFSSGWQAGSSQPRTPSLQGKGWSVEIMSDQEWEDHFNQQSTALLGDLEGDATFWQMRPELDHIRRFALARYVSPWAVLGAVLMRVITSVPPNVMLATTVGSKGSLNSFCCIVGKPGAGKNAAVRVASEAVIIMDHDHPLMIKTLAFGTGEGLLHQYAHMEKDATSKAFVQVDHDDPRFLFKNMEINMIKQLTSRGGSVLIEMIKDAFMGDDLGMSYRNQGQGSVIIRQDSYRLCMILGAQPEAIESIMSDAMGGFPQRMIFLPATDPNITEHPEPEPEPWVIPDQKWLPDSRISLPIPNEIREILVRERVAIVSRDADDDLDGHERYAQLKVAAGFMIMNGRRIMDMEDWQLAELLMQKSTATRDAAQRKIKRKHDRERDAAHKDAARQASVVRKAEQDVDDKRDHDQVRKMIITMLTDADDHRCRKRDLQRAPEAQRNPSAFLAVLGELMSNGTVVEKRGVQANDGARGVWLYLA